MKQVLPVALSIAGSDASGGAGIQADLKTFSHFGVYGEAVVTLIAVQDTHGVRDVHSLSAELVRAQLLPVLRDIPPDAIKTGALGTREIVEMLADMADDFNCPLVIDPVILSKNGRALLDDAGVDVLRRRLLPKCDLITPNLHEAALLAGIDVNSPEDMLTAGERIRDMGARAVLVKGGHLPGSALDVLVDAAGTTEYVTERIETLHTHGTGCTYSAAIAANLACGHPMREAIARAKTFITEAIRGNPGLGGGRGPLNHFGKAG